MTNVATAQYRTPKKGEATANNRTSIKRDVTAFRLTKAERDTLDRITSTRGLQSRSEAIRFAIRNIDNNE